MAPKLEVVDFAIAQYVQANHTYPTKLIMGLFIQSTYRVSNLYNEPDTDLADYDWTATRFKYKGIKTEIDPSCKGFKLL